jgi:hypothetical protein
MTLCSRDLVHLLPMFYHDVLAPKLGATYVAFVTFLPCVDARVLLEVAQLTEQLVTHRTCVWTFPRVDAAVDLETHVVRTHAPARIALVLAGHIRLAGPVVSLVMFLHMRKKVLALVKRLTTGITLTPAIRQGRRVGATIVVCRVRTHGGSNSLDSCVCGITIYTHFYFTILSWFIFDCCGYVRKRPWWRLVPVPVAIVTM